MTIGILALLVGIFVVPAVLVWAGHRLRRRSSGWRRAFWGGVTGHLIAVVIGSAAAMIPAHEWAASDTLRGAIGLWSFAVLPVFGALVARMLPRQERTF